MVEGRTSGPATPDGGPTRSRRPRIAFVLATVVLLPTLGAGALATMSAATRWSEYRTAAQVRDHATRLHHLIEARAEVNNEQSPSASLVAAAVYGVSPAQLTALTGVDYAADMRLARTRLDADSTLRAYPALGADLARVAGIREQIDGGHASYDEVVAVFGALGADVDRLWTSQLDDVRLRARTATFGGGVLQEQIVALQAANDAFDAGIVATQYAFNVMNGREGSANALALIQLSGRLSSARGQLASRLGPAAAAAQRTLLEDPATSRFAALITQAITIGLSGSPPPAPDPATIASSAVAFTDALRSVAELSAVTAAAATDLRQLALRQSTEATEALAVEAALACAIVVASVIAAMLASRAIHRPVQRLGSTARQISEGQFSVPAVLLRGPREIADTTQAVNDMTAALGALEAYTIALADDPGSPLLDRPLPGRTGQALQRALDRLRASIATAAQQRLTLQEVATHDTLTGLLNRGAARDAIERDLARSRRDRTTLSVLFIDIDGLKQINDTHGHVAGDEAIRLTADALRAATRQSDIVARIGGDEFIVSGTTVGDPSASRQLAERIRESVAKQALTADGDRIPLRCSVGVAHAEPDDTVDSLVHHADQALYDAKQRGRNTVSAYEPGDASTSPT